MKFKDIRTNQSVIDTECPERGDGRVARIKANGDVIVYFIASDSTKTYREFTYRYLKRKNKTIALQGRELGSAKAVNVRLDDRVREHLKEKALSSGYPTMSAFIRHLIMEKCSDMVLEEEELETV